MGSDDRFVATPRAALTVCHNFIESCSAPHRESGCSCTSQAWPRAQSKEWAAIQGERYSLCFPLAVPSLVTDVRRRDFTSWIKVIFRCKNRDWGEYTSQYDRRAREAVQFFLEASFRFIAESSFIRLRSIRRILYCVRARPR